MTKHINFFDDCFSIDENDLLNAPNVTNNSNNKDSNNGLITTIWGPPTWESFHAITFGYPINPSDEQKQDYLNYFRALGKVLPCIYCRDSYQRFTFEKNTILDMNVMQSRKTLTMWGFNLHNAVNKKLGVDYGETYNELCYKFESYRAKCTKVANGCVTPLDMKALSYKKAEMKRAPIIDKKYSYMLVQHALTLGLHGYKDMLDFYSSLKRNSKEWNQRDCAAVKIIKYMRKKGFNSLENGLPTKYEMLLLAMLSTSLDKEKLKSICNNINMNCNHSTTSQ
jgi:hypothetical protein